MTDKIISNGTEFGTAFSRQRERDFFLSSLSIWNTRRSFPRARINRSVGAKRRGAETEQENGLAQTLSLSVGSGSEAYPSIPQCGEILIMRYYDKRGTIHPY